MLGRFARLTMRLWPWRRDRDITEEIAAHLAMATRDRVDRGESPDAARLAAMREFGNVGLVTDATRRVWISIRLEQLAQDLRFGARILWQSPLFCLAASLLVAIVIGANTTIYSMVRAILVSPPQGITADRLVVVKRIPKGAVLADPFFSHPDFTHFATTTRTLRTMAGWSDERFTVTTDAGAHAVWGGLVTANYFDVLGLVAALGRGLSPADDLPTSALVAVISDRFWRERFGEATDVLGRRIAVNGNPATIVGIARPGFAGALLNPPEDLWLPIRAYYAGMPGENPLERRNEPLVAIVGQLATTASIRESQAEFAAMTAQLQAAYPDALKGAGAKVAAYSATALLPMADMAPYFLAAFSIITVLTLVIVSANVANLMLGRAVERQRETAVRQSLGASKPRVLRMLVAEGVAIALVAWAAACVIAWWTTRLMLRVLEPQPGILSQARPDWTLAATAMLLAVGATVAFTVAPAVQTWRLPLLPLLKSGAQSVVGGRSRLSSALMIVQLSFSVLLLTSAGFAVRSLSMLDSGEVGFDPRNMLLVTVRLGQRSAVAGPPPTPQQRDTERAAIDRIRTRLIDEPGVRAASYSRRVPGAYFLATTPVAVAGASESTPVFMRPVGPDYLRSLGVEPTLGRELTAEDRPGNTRVALINRQLADELWPGQSPLGRVVYVGPRRDPVEIVGVAPNALYDGPVHDPHPRYVFTPQHQIDDARLIDMTFFIRFDGTLDAIAPRVGRAIAEVERSLPIVSMTTMQSRLDGVTILERQVTTLLIAFAVASLVVAALGQYAVAAFNMRRRIRDFGVRMALGASTRQIQGSVLRESLRLTLVGLAVGFLLSVAAGIGFEQVLFGIRPTDPPTYLAVFVVLAVASIIASYLPAWRAGRINVVDVLRQE